MLDYNEILPKKYIVVDGEVFIVVSSHIFRKQQRKPVNQTKIKNVRTGKVIEKTFHGSEKVEEADLENQTLKYLYNAKGEYWFCEENNPKNRFSIDGYMMGDQGKFVKENTLLESVSFQNEIVGFKIPIKVDLLVKDAPPAVKGNSAQGATKQIVLETGAEINAPLFINEGDIVRINTETGEYAERVEKA